MRVCWGSRGWQPLVLAALLPTLIGVPGAGLAGSLQGSATLKLAMPVPAEALFEVQLQQQGTADSVAALLGKVRLKPAGLPPFRFRLAYVDGMVRPGQRYSLRAVISEAGRLLFRTETTQLVLTENSPPLQLELVPVGDAPLRGVTWLQVPAASQPVPPEAARQEVQLRLDPLNYTVSGSADCNRWQGSFRIEQQRLSFSPIETTPLQCEPEVMADERRFLDALALVRGWRFLDHRFELLDGAGSPLLKFETRPSPSS